MNPNNNEMVSTLPTDPVVKQPHPVNQVTTFSKYLALTLFVLLPFIGAYIGYQLAPEKVVEIPMVVNNQIVSNVSSTSSNSISRGDIEVLQDQKPVVSLRVSITQESTGDGIQIGESEIFYTVLGSEDVSLGKFKGICRSDSLTGLLEYRAELREYILTSDQIVGHVYCSIPDSGREVVLFKPFGGADNEYSILTQDLRGGEGLQPLPSDIKIIKNFSI